MVVVSFKDGTTLKFNLTKTDDYNQWLEWSSVKDFQDRITGVGIIHNRKFITMPLPGKFKSCKFYAELVYKKTKDREVLQGERLICHADDVKLSLLVYTYSTNVPPPVLCKFNVEKIGKQVFPGENYIIGREEDGSSK